MSNPSEDLGILREDCDAFLQEVLEIQRRLEPIEVAGIWTDIMAKGN